MKAIVIKPTPCCQNPVSLGKIIEIEAYLGDKISTKCVLTCDHCGTDLKFQACELYEVVYHDVLIPKSRVTLLPDENEKENKELSLEKDDELKTCN